MAMMIAMRVLSFSAFAFAFLTLILRTKLYPRVKTNREGKISHLRAPKVMGIRMKHLALQGFAAGSFVSQLWRTVCVNVQTFEEYQALLGEWQWQEGSSIFLPFTLSVHETLGFL